MDLTLFKDVYDGPKVDFLLSHAAYCGEVLKLKKGQNAVISNGRVSPVCSLNLQVASRVCRPVTASPSLFTDHWSTGGGGGF